MCESLPAPCAAPLRVPCLHHRPQLSIATAIVFYHRFYSRKSYDSYDRFRIATTCLFLAGKVEETPKKIKDVVIEAYKAQHQKPTGPEPESKEFWALKEEILVCERILLQTLDFDLTVEHAYRRASLPRRPAVAPRHRRRPLDHDQAPTRPTALALSRRPLLAYVKSIKGTRDLAQVAWNFINDSLRTTIALQVHSRLSPPASSIVGRCPTAPHRPHRVVRVRSTRRDVWRRRRSTWPLGSWTTRWCCPRITISRGVRSPHTHTPELQPRF